MDAAFAKPVPRILDQLGIGVFSQLRPRTGTVTQCTYFLKSNMYKVHMQSTYSDNYVHKYVHNMYTIMYTNNRKKCLIFKLPFCWENNFLGIKVRRTKCSSFKLNNISLFNELLLIKEQFLSGINAPETEKKTKREDTNWV